MAETEHFKNPLPDEGDLDDVPKDLAAYANALENTLWDHMQKLLTEEPDAGDLIIVNGTSDPVYKAVTGDVTISTGGVTQIGSSKIFTGNVADGQITSRLMKPTMGIKTSTADLALTEAFQDVPGGKLEITPPVASTLFVVTVFSLQVTNSVSGGGASCVGTLKLDAEAEQTSLASQNALNESGLGTTGGTCVQVYSLNLTAAEHTIKMRAKAQPHTNANAVCFASNTRMLYLLVSQ